MTRREESEHRARLLVTTILRNPHSWHWSLQGFGMLRLYLSPEVRLHVWDDRFAVPNVSTMHDHPWNFTSYVVCGEVTNQRYSPEWGVWADDSTFHCARIMCGPGGGACPLEPLPDACLRREPVERYGPGATYSQHCETIHSSHPTRGTVTICTRDVSAGRSRDHARVFWPKGGRWVTAEPRDATADEIDAMCGSALELLGFS